MPVEKIVNRILRVVLGIVWKAVFVLTIPNSVLSVHAGRPYSVLVYA